MKANKHTGLRGGYRPSTLDPVGRPHHQSRLARATGKTSLPRSRSSTEDPPIISPPPSEPGAIADTPHQPASFLAAYALAWSGGSIAYAPFLTLLLSIRFSELAGRDDVHWLALCATIGAVAASFSNILWGWASDRWPRGAQRRRMMWSGAGLAATALGCWLIVRAATPLAMLVAVAGWQVALNLMLAPLAAYAADSIGDRQKGTLGGLLALAPAFAALSLIGVAMVPAHLADQLALIMLIVTLLMLPLLLSRRARPLGTANRQADPRELARPDHRTLLLLWLARLFVQVAEGLLFLFIFYFLREVSAGHLALGTFAWTSAGVQLAAIPVALWVGRQSDRHDRRKLPLLAMLGLIALGLGGMALATSWAAVIACYALFLMGSNSFLALHATFTMQHLPDPRRFGRDLGLFNLTNTLPSLTSPMLAALVIGHYGYHGLLAMLTLVMLIPAAILSQLKLR